MLLKKTIHLSSLDVPDHINLFLGAIEQIFWEIDPVVTLCLRYKKSL